jgi:hypothetical protein
MKNLVIRKCVFEKKSPKLAFWEFFWPSGDILPLKKTLVQLLPCSHGVYREKQLVDGRCDILRAMHAVCQ